MNFFDGYRISDSLRNVVQTFGEKGDLDTIFMCYFE
ncbi:FxsA [Vibrio mediterranei AK1]|nr:FxsA [Vibrio mediterranei AK1]